MAIRFWAIVAVAACAATANAADTAPQRYDAATFFQPVSFSPASQAGYAFSPDGRNLLISSDETGVFNAYAIDVRTGERTALTQSDADAVFAVSYFPDDDRVLYTSDEGGDELNHVYVKTPDGQPIDLTPGEAVKASFLGWSEDGESLYLATNERDNKAFDVYSYTVDDFTRTQIFENKAALEVNAIGPKGRYLALTRNDTSANSNIFLVDLAADEPKPELITPHDGDIAYGVYAFTPDGATLVYATDEHGEFNQAWTYDLETGDRAPLVVAEWDVSGVSFSRDGRYQVTTVNADAQTVLTLTDFDHGVDVGVGGLPAGDLRAVRFDAEAKQIAFVVNGDTQPSNIFVAGLSAYGVAAPKQLTDALSGAVAASDLVEGEVVRYASFDGLEVPGVLYKPHGASAEAPVPALVWVHGGPGGQSRKGYSAAVQHLVNQGYGVLMANNRGSSGYGKTFFHMDDRDHGGSDLKDIVAARPYLEGLDWVDGEKIGVIGGSYGGYMVVAALAFHPQAFDVGIDIFGVTNWERTLSSIPPWWESFRKSLYDEMGDPAVDGERHAAISPLFHAENIVKPLLVVQGANDPRELQAESDDMVAAVRANGVPVEYILFPDEGHGFRKRENRITASDAYARFLDAYLRGDGPASRPSASP
ncbi:MAG: S9 family peptidase [Maricaulaceae bacterium]